MFFTFARTFLTALGIVLMPIFGLAEDTAVYRCDTLLVHEDLDEEALKVLEKVVMNQEGHREATAKWLVDLEKRKPSESTNLTVLEHTALSYMLKTSYFQDLDSPELMKTAHLLLRNSWLDLTGRLPENLHERLPRRVLYPAGRKARAFHAASFQSKWVAEANHEVAIGEDYVPEPQDLLMVAGTLALAFTETGSTLIGSSLLGYALVTSVEHLIHRFFGHLPSNLKKITDKMGWLGRSIDRTGISHKLHHKNFAKDYAEQFASPEEREKFEDKMKAMGKWYENLAKSDYGLSLSPKGMATGLAISLPIHALIAWVIGVDPVGYFGLVLPGTMYVLASAYLHPYLHMTRENALAKASAPMRWFLKTRYVEMMSRLHYGHHAGRGGNFNLVFGADYIFGQLRKPNLQQLFRMRQLQLIGSY